MWSSDRHFMAPANLKNDLVKRQGFKGLWYNDVVKGVGR